VRTVVLPAANATDLELLPAEVTDEVRFELVRTMDEVLGAVLAPPSRRSVAAAPVPSASIDASPPHG
jgi:ATP-dependent Lon protease